MTKCKGITVKGNRCRAPASENGYCYRHAPTNSETCVVCLEKFGPNDSPLPCGHWVHRSCVQKSADAMQDLLAGTDYPPVEECKCPICRAPVPDLKPKDPQPVAEEDFDVTLPPEDMYRAYSRWQTSDRSAPLAWYIWGALCDHHQDRDPEQLMLAADVFENMIRMGVIPSGPPQPDTRFARALQRRW